MENLDSELPEDDATVITDLRRLPRSLLPGPKGTLAGGRDEESTAVSVITDIHRSKVPPDDPRLKLERPSARTLRKGPVLAIALALVGVITVALIAAMLPPAAPADDGAKSANGEAESAAIAANPATLPEVLLRSNETVEPIRTPEAKPLEESNKASRPPSAAAERAESAAKARYEGFMHARGAGIFAAVDDQAPSDISPPPPPGATVAPPDGAKTVPPPASTATETSRDPNLQERKNDFVAKSGMSATEYLPKGMTTPRSPYEIKAGTVIPVVLITGINSDLPGQIVGQVRENVYDTVSGNFLLVPQGSRVLAAYDSMVAWGQERVLVCWNRIIRPDGTSIVLDCMPGVDLAGYSGFSDDVDNHWWRIITGAVFSSLLAATAQRSQGDVTGFQPTFPQVWASGAASQISQTGQQITAKNIQIQPTITVRPGFSVNVLVSKDIVLPPFGA